jgi:hypothetical protein
VQLVALSALPSISAVMDQRNDWIAKTADGCAWGAASVAIWVLKREPGGYHVVLFSGGQMVSLRNSKAGDVLDLQIVNQTAGHYS